MLYRKPPKSFRIPHQLAALAAIMLLVTAWTGNDSEPSERSHAATDGQGLISLRQVSGDDDHDNDSITDRQTRSPASLMLFRFN